MTLHEVFGCKFAEPVPHAIFSLNDRRDPVDPCRRIAKEPEAKPEVHVAEKLVFKPEIYLRTCGQIRKLFEFRHHRFAVVDRPVRIRLRKVLFPDTPKLVQARGAHVAVNECLATYNNITLETSLFEFFNLSIARKNVHYHTYNVTA